MLVPEKFDNLCKVAEHLYNGSSNITVEPKVIVDKTSGDFTSNKP